MVPAFHGTHSAHRILLPHRNVLAIACRDWQATADERCPDMKHMVSYKLRPDRVTENERLASAVFDALKQARPASRMAATP